MFGNSQCSPVRLSAKPGKNKRVLNQQQQLKEYANEVMDEYPRDFKKENVQRNDDILYFGKVEKHRYYTHKDEGVKQGLAKRGEQKPRSSARPVHCQSERYYRPHPFKSFK